MAGGICGEPTGEADDYGTTGGAGLGVWSGFVEGFRREEETRQGGSVKRRHSSWQGAGGWLSRAGWVEKRRRLPWTARLARQPVCHMQSMRIHTLLIPGFRAWANQDKRKGKAMLRWRWQVLCFCAWPGFAGIGWLQLKRCKPGRVERDLGTDRGHCRPWGQFWALVVWGATLQRNGGGAGKY